MTSYSKPVVTIWIYIASFLPHDAMLALCVLWPCVAHMSNQQPIPTACREVSLRGDAGSRYNFCRNFFKCTAMHSTRRGLLVHMQRDLSVCLCVGFERELCENR